MELVLSELEHGIPERSISALKEFNKQVTKFGAYSVVTYSRVKLIGRKYTNITLVIHVMYFEVH